MTNPANNIATDDFITIDIKVRVDTVLANQDGIILGNHANLSFVGPSEETMSRDFDADTSTPSIQPLDLEIVEPMLDTQAGPERNGLQVSPVSRFPTLGLVFSSLAGVSEDFDQAYPFQWHAVVGAGGYGEQESFAPWRLLDGRLIQSGDGLTGGLPMLGK